MANERLQAALTHAGLTAQELAEHVGVDVKTIERWVSGRVPHRRNRIKVARALATTPSEVWPDQDTASIAPPAPRDSDGELVAAYPAAVHPAAPDPRELIQGASERIDLLDLSAADLVDAETLC